MCHTTVKSTRETVFAYDIDGVRKLMVPNRNPVDIPGIFTKSEFARLKNQAHVSISHQIISMFSNFRNK